MRANFNLRIQLLFLVLVPVPVLDHHSFVGGGCCLHSLRRIQELHKIMDEHHQQNFV